MTNNIMTKEQAINAIIEIANNMATDFRNHLAGAVATMLLEQGFSSSHYTLVTALERLFPQTDGSDESATQWFNLTEPNIEEVITPLFPDDGSVVVSVESLKHGFMYTTRFSSLTEMFEWLRNQPYEYIIKKDEKNNPMLVRYDDYNE